MMILQKKVVALFSAAILMLFVASCSTPSSPVASGDTPRSTPPPEHSSSNFNLATPVLSGSQSGPGQITLSWPNGRTAGSILPGGQYYPTNWTGANVANGVEPGSEHTDIFWLVNDAWVKYGEHVGQAKNITGLADGTYTFYVKEKSKENSKGSETETFHSDPSNVIEVVVSSCTVQYNVSSITAPTWNYGRGVNPAYAPIFDNDGEYVSGNYQIIVCAVAAQNTGSVSIDFNLAATCNGTANGRNDVTGQVYDGLTAIGSPVTATWDGTKYVLANMTYPSGVASWSIKIQVAGIDVMTPIALVGISNESWTVTSAAVPSGTVDLTTNALTRKAHTGKDYNFTFTLAAAASNCNQSITGRTIRMRVNNPNESLPYRTAAEPDPILTPGTYKFVGSNGIPYAITSSVANNTVLTVDFEILNPVTNQYEPIETGWTFKPTP